MPILSSNSGPSRHRLRCDDLRLLRFADDAQGRTDQRWLPDAMATQCWRGRRSCHSLHQGHGSLAQGAFARFHVRVPLTAYRILRSTPFRTASLNAPRTFLCKTTFAASIRAHPTSPPSTPFSASIASNTRSAPAGRTCSSVRTE